jgi:hypothetical protein
MSSADYQRQWRARHGARTGIMGPPVRRGCGTPAAYRRHLRNGEVPCAACKAAHAQRLSEYRKTKRGKNGKDPRPER